MSLRRPAPRTGLSDATEHNMMPGASTDVRHCDEGSSTHPAIGTSLHDVGRDENTPRFPPPPIEAPPYVDGEGEGGGDSRARDVAAAEEIARAMNLSAVTDTDSLWACTPAPQVMRARAKSLGGESAASCSLRAAWH